MMEVSALMHIEEFVSRREELLNTRPVTGLQFGKAYSALVDRALQDIVSKSGADDIAGLTLVATGGYGRRELAPYSDIDIAFLASDEDDPKAAAAIKQAFQLITEHFLDRIGLKLGYSYRLLEDIPGLDFQTQTALLDARILAGNQDLATVFSYDLRTSLDANFILKHIRSRKSDLSRLYVMEPDVKNGPGGLRDLHAISWAAQALYSCSPTEVWESMEENRITQPEQAKEFRTCADTLFRVRNALHIVASKPLNVLTVERQPEVADLLEYSSSRALMDDYYAYSSIVKTAAKGILSSLGSSRLRIDKAFCIADGKLALPDKPQALSKPGALVRAFRLARDYGVGIGERLEREMRFSTGSEVSDKHNYAELKEILAAPAAYPTLSLMVDMGVLQKLIPAFGKLLHRIPEEKVHEYTVGQHSLMVVKHLDVMRSGNDELYAGLSKMVQDQAELTLAALLHDIGKLNPTNGEHNGAAQAAEIARQIGFGENSVRTVEFLVANHELMSATARRCDVTADVVVAEFARSVGDANMLRMLFLLNVADVMSVGQASWSEMQRRFLEQLYFPAEAKLTLPEPKPDAEEKFAKRLKKELSLSNLPEDVVQEHCDNMPPSYLLNTRPERIAAHIEHVLSAIDGPPVVELKQQPDSRVTELTVCVVDTGPGLLAKIAGALFAMGIAVHDASVHTRHTKDSIAVDTIWIDHMGDRLPFGKRKEVERELVRVLSGECTVLDLLQARGKSEPREPSCKSAQILRHHGSHTGIEIRATDSEGLLYSLSRTIAEQGWNILSARVTTIGRAVVDTFEVSGPKGCLTAGDIKRLRLALGC